MKKIFFSIFLFCLSSMLAYSHPVDDGADIRLKIENIQTAKGNIMVAIYNSEATYMEERFRSRVIPVTQTGELNCVLKDLPAGTYAVSLFHDENENKRLDKNLLGIPTEMFAFSNNAKVSFGPAPFEEASFEVKGEDVELSISLGTLL